MFAAMMLMIIFSGFASNLVARIPMELSAAAPPGLTADAFVRGEFSRLILCSFRFVGWNFLNQFTIGSVSISHAILE